MFALCPLVLVIFHKQYRLRQPTDSVLEKSVRLINYACKGKISANPVRTYVTTRLFPRAQDANWAPYRYRNLKDESFWNDVKPSRVENKPKWMTFDDLWVDEVARGVKACLVFAFYPLFCECMAGLRPARRETADSSC